MDTDVYAVKLLKMKKMFYLQYLPADDICLVMEFFFFDMHGRTHVH